VQSLLAVVLREPQGDTTAWCKAAKIKSSKTFYNLRHKLLGDEIHPALILHQDGVYTAAPDLIDKLDALASSPLYLPAGKTTAAELQAKRHAKIETERHGFDRYLEANPIRTKVDRTTGEITKIERPRVRRKAAELPTEHEPAKSMKSDHERMKPSPSPHIDRSPLGRCAACGQACDDREPSTGLIWHQWCLIPRWVAAIHERQGISIPDDLIAPKRPPETVDAFDTDWAERPVVSGHSVAT